ncbi:unnamed protein product [Phytophthora lilii]|uniref:Unnamed protein product n=1 Tax=Phytophthora lilii TaxID=2077276 RepID=A0A9W6YKH1_9STRA|nr:unnamed protein product [Phytophthora lilii]
MGWWSSQKYDKRKRMRALVQGAVNDARTRILLDTGANVSVVSAALAKRLRLRDIPDHRRSLEVKGTDFMIPAGVRLDLFHGTARLPDEVMVPLVKSANAPDEASYAHLPLLVWTPHGELPREPGYVRLNSARYNEWQVLAYANAREKELYKNERELYEQWLATQPPAVERPAYATPKEILRRPSEASLEGDIQEWACTASDGSSSSDTDPEVSVDSPKDSRDEIQPTGATTEAADIQPSELDPTEGPLFEGGGDHRRQCRKPLPILEYAMPLVDDLLTEMEAYLWFCSLDAASEFWAVMMTQRARKVSAFVCALGHFEWLRMPFGLKNAPMTYQRMLDNALWGFVQPKGGPRDRSGPYKPASKISSGLDKFDAARSAHNGVDPFSQLVNSPDADMFLTGEPDESSLVPVFDRRSFVDDICFGAETFDACLAMLDRLLSRFEECRISVSFTKSIFVQPRVDFLSHQVSSGGIRADPKKLIAITELSFPASKKGMQAFLGALNYYSRFIQDFAVYAAVLYQLADDDSVYGISSQNPSSSKYIKY